MSLIDGASPEGFFANLIVPLKRFNAARQRHYFARQPDAAQGSYWEDVSSRTGGMGVVPATCDATGLLDQLAEHWRLTGDQPLARLLPYLKRLQQGIWQEASRPEAAKAADTVPDTVYPLF
jgi:hypothetical protein